MSTLPRYIYLCNAIDEATVERRAITTDSPAATRKVFNLCRALKDAGSIPYILSLGRGRQNGSGALFPTTARQVSGIGVLYAAFWHLPVLTHMTGALSLLPLAWRLKRDCRQATLIFYNRGLHYLPVLLLARILGWSCYLDLEDGLMLKTGPVFNRWRDRLLVWIYDACCAKGAILSCEELKTQTKNQRTHICYGVAEGRQTAPKKWDAQKLYVLFGGFLYHERGCELFIEAVRFLQRHMPDKAETFFFRVTGRGPMEAEIARFAAGEARQLVSYQGRVGREQYQHYLGSSHLGLVLNPPHHELSRSTFPSKAIELAESGMLVVATKVSDIPLVFPAGTALLLDDDTPAAVAQALAWVSENRGAASEIAVKGRARILEQCDPRRVGAGLKKFLEG